MRANPGGVLPPELVLGRDELIRQLWRVLDNRSARVEGERRTGKSCLVQKMAAEPPPGICAVYQDLEDLRSPLEFVEAISRRVEPHLRGGRKMFARLRRLVKELGGVELLGARIPSSLGTDWKRLMLALFDDLQEQLEAPLVFFWDEVPYMLQKIREGQDEETAREVLDVLRKVRQTCPRIRMVYTGSIGLHHVLDSLSRTSRTPHAPTNDMEAVHVPPLRPADGAELARRLLVGEELPVADSAGTAIAISTEVGHLPYYIHHVVVALARQGGAVDPARVRAIVTHAIEDPSDPWELTHYRRRLRPYYRTREALAVTLLDTVAGASAPVRREQLVARAQATGVAGNLELALAMLDSLQVDHYLQRDAAGRFTFASIVVLRWWTHHRMLRSAEAGADA